MTLVRRLLILLVKVNAIGGLGLSVIQDISDDAAEGDDQRLGSRIGLLRAAAADLIKAGVNVVLPTVCLSCREPLSTRDTLCPACWRDVTFIHPPICDALGLPMPFDAGGVMISAAAQADPPLYHRGRAVGVFDGVIRRLIHDFKYRDRLELRVLFGRWMKQAGADLLEDADIIVPVPLYRWRMLSRRYNQSAILARELALSCRAKFDPHVLVRSRRTVAQVGLSPSQRKINVRGAFKVRSSRRSQVEGRRVLLVDDVVTTGATADACARALVVAGACEVNLLTLALTSNRGAMTT